LSYAAARGWTLSSRIFWHDGYFSDNDQTLPIGSQLVVDVEGAYPVTRRLTAYVQVQNLLGERHIIDNAGTSAPQLETPFSAMAGVRASF
jgi:outer membrane receptor protein involved in Fe transport